MNFTINWVYHPPHSPNTVTTAHWVTMRARDSSSDYFYWWSIADHPSQMWRQKRVEGKVLSEEYPTDWQSWDLKPGSLSPKPIYG